MWERNINWLPPLYIVCALDWGLNRKPRQVLPDWDSNPQPLGYGITLQLTEPHQLGLQFPSQYFIHSPLFTTSFIPLYCTFTKFSHFPWFSPLWFCENRNPWKPFLFNLIFVCLTTSPSYLNTGGSHVFFLSHLFCSLWWYLRTRISFPGNPNLLFNWI